MPGIKSTISVQEYEANSQNPSPKAVAPAKPPPVPADGDQQHSYYPIDFRLKNPGIERNYQWTPYFPLFGQHILIKEGRFAGSQGVILNWTGDQLVVKVGAEEEILSASQVDVIHHPHALIHPPDHGSPKEEKTRSHKEVLPKSHKNKEKLSSHDLKPVKIRRNLVKAKLVHKYVRVCTGRHAGSIGFIIKGANGYYTVVFSSDSDIGNEIVMKRAQDLIEVPKPLNFVHHPSTAAIAAAASSSSPPRGRSKQKSSSSSASASFLSSPTHSPLHSHEDEEEDDSQDTDLKHDVNTDEFEPSSSLKKDEKEERWDLRSSKRRRPRMRLRSLGGRESWIGRKVIVREGKFRGEVGIVKRSGHGFYCLELAERGEIMKRGADLELYEDDEGEEGREREGQGREAEEREGEEMDGESDGSLTSDKGVWSSSSEVQVKQAAGILMDLLTGGRWRHSGGGQKWSRPKHHHDQQPRGQRASVGVGTEPHPVSGEEKEKRLEHSDQHQSSSQQTLQLPGLLPFLPPHTLPIPSSSSMLPPPLSPTHSHAVQAQAQMHALLRSMQSTPTPTHAPTPTPTYMPFIPPPHLLHTPPPLPLHPQPSQLPLESHTNRAEVDSLIALGQ